MGLDFIEIGVWGVAPVLFRTERAVEGRPHGASGLKARHDRYDRHVRHALTTRMLGRARCWGYGGPAAESLDKSFDKLRTVSEVEPLGTRYRVNFAPVQNEGFELIERGVWGEAPS